jgi:hypothetical protein
MWCGLFPREQRDPPRSGILFITEAMVQPGQEDTDMERANKVQSLSEAELEIVTGGLGLSVKTEERLALQRQLTRAYAIANPYDYYGVTWIG